MEGRLLLLCLLLRGALLERVGHAAQRTQRTQRDIRHAGVIDSDRSYCMMEGGILEYNLRYGKVGEISHILLLPILRL